MWKMLTNFLITISPHLCFYQFQKIYIICLNMTIDNVLNVQHLQQVQYYPFVIDFAFQ
jgi:hypothetical protein